MKKVNTLPGEWYCVTAAAGTTVTASPDGGKPVTLLTMEEAGQASFLAIDNEIVISDDAAIVLPTDAPAAVVSGGGVTMPRPLPAADSPVPLLHERIYTYEQGEAESLDWSALRMVDTIGTTAEIWLTTSENPPEIVWPQDWVWRGTCADDTPPLLPCAKLCVFLLRRDAVGVTARLADVRGEERPYVQPVMTGFDSWSNQPSFGVRVSGLDRWGADVSAYTESGITIYAWQFFASGQQSYTLFFNPGSRTESRPRELIMAFERPLKITKFRWAHCDTDTNGWFSYDILADDVIIISDRTHWHNSTKNLVDIPVPKLNQRYALTYRLRLMPYNSGWSSGRFEPQGNFKIVGVY